jgi:hypothetical protein
MALTKTEFYELIKPFFQREFNPSETLQWLQANRMMYFSWGSNDLRSFENKALAIKVSGHHHKGDIVITLGWNDTYTLTLINTVGTVKGTFTNIYCDQLAEFIDVKIERIGAYKH